MNVFKLKTYGFDGEVETTSIKTHMNKERFEQLLVDVNEKAMKENLISSTSIFHWIIEEIKKRDCVEVHIYNEEYILEDDMPIPDSTYWEKKGVKYERLK